ELPLHADLDPEALAVEPVLEALVEAAQRLVALEDVLQRPSPGGVDRELLVGGDRAVGERPRRRAAVLRPQLLERLLALPEVEDLELERVRIGNRRQLPEHGPSLPNRQSASASAIAPSTPERGPSAGGTMKAS